MHFNYTRHTPLNFPSIEHMTDLTALEAYFMDEIEKSKQALDHFLTLETPNFDDLQAMDDDDTFSRLYFYLSHLNSMEQTDERDSLMQKIREKNNEYFGMLHLNETYLKQMAYLLANEPRLHHYEQRSIQKTLDDFEKNGGLLPQTDKDQLQQWKLEMMNLSQQFATNITKFQKEMYLDILPSELDGVEAHIMAAIHKNPTDATNGSVRIFMQPAIISEVMATCHNEKTRHALFTLNQQKGVHPNYNNLPIVEDILILRKKMAQLLNTNSYADMALEERMAKNADNAIQFIEQLAEKALPYAHQDVKKLNAFAEQYGLDNSKPYNRAYIADQYAKKVLSYDSEQVRQYFPLSKAKETLFAWIKEHYGITISEYKHSELWHNDAQAWQWTNYDGQIIGYSLEDLFQRAGKRNGAYMSGYQSYNNIRETESNHPECLVVMNLVKEDGDTYLEIGDIETLFHEYGHALHHMLTTIDSPAYNGTRVARDAVELPSQLMELFLTKDLLQQMSAHKVTDERLPDELYDIVERNNKNAQGMFVIGQSRYALFDLYCHHNDLGAQESWKKVCETYAVYNDPVTYSIPSSFSHIFNGGYAAGYYGYLWADVLAADMYQWIQQQPNQKEALQHFRHTLLSQGDDKTMDILFKECTGREPNPESLLVKLGLQEANICVSM